MDNIISFDMSLLNDAMHRIQLMEMKDRYGKKNGQLIEIVILFSTIKQLIADNCFDSKLTNCNCFFILAIIDCCFKITIK